MQSPNVETQSARIENFLATVLVQSSPDKVAQLYFFVDAFVSHTP